MQVKHYISQPFLHLTRAQQALFLIQMKLWQVSVTYYI